MQHSAVSAAGKQKDPADERDGKRPRLAYDDDGASEKVEELPAPREGSAPSAERRFRGYKAETPSHPGKHLYRRKRAQKPSGALPAADITCTRATSRRSQAQRRQIHAQKHILKCCRAASQLASALA